MFKKKALSETAIEGIVYLFIYLINDKKASDEELSWQLSIMLSNLGVKVDYIPEPSPWRKKKE